MRVVSVCEYVVAQQRSQDHWSAFKLVRALKGENFRGYGDIWLNGRWVRLDERTRDHAFEWAGQMIAPEIENAFESVPIALVPIPGSSCASVADVQQSRSHRLALAISAAMTRRPIVGALLHWDQPHASSRAGHTRNADSLSQHYVATPPLLGHRIVLVDDVLTTGGHILGAAIKLRACGYETADVAFAIARTCWPDDGSSRPPTNKAFSVAVDEILEYTPPF